MPADTIICPLCSDTVDKLLYRYHLDSERTVIEQIKSHNPSWTENDGACSRCIDFYHTEIVIQQRIIPGIGPHFPVRSIDDFIILPTGLRLDADQRYTGKGVTICFIDSGFYPHPDLIATRNRIKVIIDITEDTIITGTKQQDSNWHGTMTSVVCAGDGYLGNGLYKGIASGADLVLLKVQSSNGKISTENMIKALQWVQRHHKEYDIRIVNMSIGDDEVMSYTESEVDRLAELLITEGITVVAACGNDINGQIKPPANSPHVIAVGGLDDNNDLNLSHLSLYHSTYGKTADKLTKPDLIAPAIWIAAPILPETEEANEAAMLHGWLAGTDETILQQLPQLALQTSPDHSPETNTESIRQRIIGRVQACKFISPHYMHVDGTSFAAPIVSSIIAQLLEANPTLNPSMIRDILFSTAKRVDNFPAERQGFGVVSPRRALLKALQKQVFIQPATSPQVNNQQNTITFYVQHNCAHQIALAGSFNQWAQDVLLFEPGKHGLWKIEIPLLPAGQYTYKFFIDDKIWIEDINNPYREPDGFNGFNSILIINNN